MVMETLEALSHTSKSTMRRPAVLRITKKRSASSKQPRIVHTFSPKIIKIQPEEFLDVVQRLTGRASSEVPSSTSQETSSDSETYTSDRTTARYPILRAQGSAFHYRNVRQSSEALPTPKSTQLLAALPSPRLVTLNFLPMLASPSTLNTPRTAEFANTPRDKW